MTSINEQNIHDNENTTNKANKITNKRPKKAVRLSIAPDLYRKVFVREWKRTMGPIKTHARSSTILPHFIGLDFDIYNGKTYGRVTPTESMVGHKFGEFVATRKFKGHTSSKK